MTLNGRRGLSGGNAVTYLTDETERRENKRTQMSIMIWSWNKTRKQAERMDVSDYI